MRMREFIKQHRTELDSIIKRALERPNDRGQFIVAPDHYNDEERRQWILNDYGLYQWAKSEGVRI